MNAAAYFVPLVPGLFALSYLPYKFDPSAQCPTWCQFLHDVVGR